MGFFENTRAMARFYDDEVTVDGVRPSGRFQTGAVPACVFDEGLEDPLDDDGTSTRRRRFVVHIRRDDWPEVPPPQIGDQVTLEAGATLSVMSLEVSHGDYVMEARTC